MKAIFCSAKLLKIGGGSPFCRVSVALPSNGVERNSGTSKKPPHNEYDIRSHGDVQELDADPELFDALAALPIGKPVDFALGPNPRRPQTTIITGV